MSAMHLQVDRMAAPWGLQYQRRSTKRWQRTFPSPDTRIIGEPGRYMVQDAATIACAINGVRPRHALVRVQACMGEDHCALVQHSVEKGLCCRRPSCRASRYRTVLLPQRYDAQSQ